MNLKIILILIILPLTSFAAQSEQKLRWSFQESVIQKDHIWFENPMDYEGRVLTGMYFEPPLSENKYLHSAHKQKDFSALTDIRRSLGLGAKTFCENNYNGSSYKFDTLAYEVWHMAEDDVLLAATEENQRIHYGVGAKNKLVRNFTLKPVKKGSAVIVLTGVECLPPVVPPAENAYGGFLLQ